MIGLDFRLVLIYIDIDKGGEGFVWFWSRGPFFCALEQRIRHVTNSSQVQH